MSERDMLIERLEKKLIEKEREVMELRRMLSEKTNFDENLKQSIIDEIKKELQEGVEHTNLTERISDIESKIVELRRAVESLMGEVVYLKNELRELSGKNDAEKMRQKDREQVELEERFILETPQSRTDDTLIIPDREQFSSEFMLEGKSKKEQVKEPKSKIRNEKSETASRRRGEKSEHSKIGEDDLIICD
jgi:hypothetical protein